MKNLFKFAAISILLVGVFRCSAASPEKAATEARIEAADARVAAADANARVMAADANVKAADARVKAADAGVATAAPSPPAKTIYMPAKARVVIPSGTVFKVSLIDALDSDANSPGDRFLASLTESVVVNGATLLPKGTRFRGRVIDAEGAGSAKGRAAIRLSLTHIMQGDRMVAIMTETFAATADSAQNVDAEIIAGSAGVGAVKGKEIHYNPETRLNFTLTNSVEL